MTDLRATHIESLVYSLQPSEFVVYDNPPPLKLNTNIFEGTLENNVLTCRLKVYSATEAEAKAAVEGTLRAWEINAALQRGYPEFKFVFQKVVLVDRNPPEGKETSQPQVVTEAADYIKAEVRFGRIKLGQYPPPPQNFCVTPEVEALWMRYEGYLRGREPLLAMASFCLTVIKDAYNGRTAAAKQMNIDEAVLNKIGNLTATRGDLLTARKINAQSTKQPISGQERAWLQEAVRAVIRRLGEARSLTPSKTLAMKDLPPLDQ